jgi:Tfp pilus assembly protein PilP
VSKTPATKPSIQSAKAAASQPATKPSSVSTAKPAAVSAQAKSAPVKPEAKSVAAKPVAVKPAAVKPVAVAKPAAVKAVLAVPAKTPGKETNKAAETKPAAKDASAGKVSVEKAPEPAKNEKAKTYSANGRRDPFVSPVVAQSAVGSGCSTGKRCLAVDQISLKGVVKSETGMIAVVVNALDKAYFLRENDPIFDGYVLKITGDSIVFKETVQDKLGKPFTKEVTKKLNTPAV